MRGIITIAAAASIPLTTTSGAPFPGREVIQAVAFLLAFATLLVQGATLPFIARRLRIDTAADERAEGIRLAEAIAVVAALQPDMPGPLDSTGAATSYQRRRDALTMAVVQGDIDDESARHLIHEIDLAESLASDRRLDHP